MAESIRINFGKPMPLFPLRDTVLLPHAILPLHIFEQRFRQMIDTSLDESGQIAVASYSSEPHAQAAEDDEAEAPALRPAVCVGQIVQHEALPDGSHNVLLHGICRASIVNLRHPSGDRTYCVAELVPLEEEPGDHPDMPDVRSKLRSMLTGPRLSRMRSVDTVLEWFDRDDIPTHALLELIGFMLVKDNEVKYKLLAEPDPGARADLIKQELYGLDRLVRRAERQSYEKWPKGMSWN